jgi:pimeloyl-ACP methyl ester carboxylesterase
MIGDMSATTERPAMIRLRHVLVLLCVWVISGIAMAADLPIAYPYPLQHFAFESQRQNVDMAYMDIEPSVKANGRSVLLLHGKNFCALYWQGTIESLTAKGYRVIAPEQIGFCSSSKPERYQFSFPQLAANTRALLDKLGLQRVSVVGHSMGGMLAVRYALTYRQNIDKLVLVNPLGLEDWRAKGVPYRSIDDWYKRELATSYESIEKYQRTSYYAGEWKPEYERLARHQASLYAGADRERLAWDQALAYDMIFNEPFIYELDQIGAPTTLIIGQRDRTAVGKDTVPEAVAATLGNYPTLARTAATRMPNTSLIELDGLGHVPQIEDPARFQPALLKALSKD